MIRPAEAADAAKQAFFRMQRDGNSVTAAAGPSTHAGIPMLVVRLDTRDQNYFIVPWVSGRGVVAAIVIDAQNGVMTSAAAIAPPQQQLMPSAEEARRVVFDRLGARAVAAPKLVWRPCRESSSPLAPFYAIAVEDGEVYVFNDGSASRRLTLFERGG